MPRRKTTEEYIQECKERGYDLPVENYINNSTKIEHKCNKSGYFKVCLYKDNNIKNMYIHQLVAKAFIPNPNNLHEVNHIDEDKSNNIVDNLEWCDRNYNINYGTRNKRYLSQ